MYLLWYHPLTFRAMAATVTDRWNFALLFTIIVQVCAVVWWGSRITKAQEVLTAAVVRLEENDRLLEASQIDLQIRMAVQEAMAERAKP